MDAEHTPGPEAGSSDATYTRATDESGAADPPAAHSALDMLTQLRDQVEHARSVPMSASCLINRGDVLALLNAIREELPDAIEQAEQVVRTSAAKVAEGQAEADRIVAEARARALELANESDVAKTAEDQAATVKAEAEAEAEALRIETDAFIDSRMASFESVLHKTSSQVKTARARLSERSKLDTASADPELPPLE